jgi:uncharacterized protein (TIGR03086 family)
MDMVKVLEQQLNWTGKIIENVGKGQLAGASPCAELDCKGVINHVTSANYYFETLATGGTVDPGAPTPDLVGDDPAGAYRKSAEMILDRFRNPATMQATFKFPFGEMPGEMAIGVVVMENTVHGWDIAKASGQDATIDPDVASALLPGAQGIPDTLRNEQGNPFKPAVNVPDDASATEKLVAALGRTP